MRYPGRKLPRTHLKESNSFNFLYNKLNSLKNHSHQSTLAATSSPTIEGKQEKRGILTGDNNTTSSMVPYLLTIPFMRKPQVYGTISSSQSTIFSLTVYPNRWSLDTEFLDKQESPRLVNYSFSYINIQISVALVPLLLPLTNHAKNELLHMIQRMMHQQDFQ